jgi:tetratricopeptide (TPR) repeat protein
MWASILKRVVWAAALASVLLPAQCVRGQSPEVAKALALERQGKFEEATQAWQVVTERNPRDAAAFASLGVALSRERKYQEAADAYRKSLALNPKLPGVSLNLGLAEFKLGLFQEAVAPLLGALAADGHNQQARALLGLSYYGAGKFAEASQELEIATKSDPANTELRQVLAQSCLWAKNYSCAVEQYRQILRLNPDSAAAHILSGQALDGLGRTPEAIEEFQAATKAAPQDANAMFGLGYLYWKQRQDELARAAFETALTIDANHAQALAYLGDIEMRQGSEKALADLAKAIDLNRKIRIAYSDLGAIYMDQKRYPEALAALQQAVKLDPTQPDTHFRLGRLHQAMGNPAAAKLEFDKVRELQKKSEGSVMEKMGGAPPALKQ